MRHFRTPAGEVHSLRFTPDGRSIYLISCESLEGVAGIAGGTLFQNAYRLDAFSGEITGRWAFRGSEVAILTEDFRSLYHSVSVAVAGRELDLWSLDLVTGKVRGLYEANVPYPHELALTPNGHIL